MQTDNLTDTDLHTFWTYKLQLGLSFLLIQNIQYICVSLKSESIAVDIIKEKKMDPW